MVFILMKDSRKSTIKSVLKDVKEVFKIGIMEKITEKSPQVAWIDLGNASKESNSCSAHEGQGH